MYSYFGISRQGFIKGIHRLEEEINLIKAVEKEVKKYRLTNDARAGSRSLYYNLDVSNKYKIGINKFENLLSRYELTLRTIRIKIVTTQSCDRSKKYKNLANGLEISNINQIIVGDLTYINIEGLRYYVFSLFDVMSARLVGIYGGQRMRAIEACEALKAFIFLRKKRNIKRCIHHTDGGSQYFSDMYLAILKACGIQISVARSCLENGYAEQRNGMIKMHYLGLKRGRNETELNKSLQEIKELYNNRKQQGLGWKSPIEFEDKLKVSKKNERKLLFKFTESLGSF
jgi:transposase InsO family protein